MKSPDQFNLEQPIEEEKTTLEKIGGQAKKLVKIGVLSFLTMAGPSMASESSAKERETKKVSATQEEIIRLDNKSKATFKLNDRREVVGFKSNFKAGYEENVESIRLLKEGWFDMLRENIESTQELSKAKDVIENIAKDLFFQNKVIRELEEMNRGDGPEAKFLRKNIEETIKTINDKYGDIFI